MVLLRHTLAARPQLTAASLSSLLDCNRRWLLPRAFAQVAEDAQVPVSATPPPPPHGRTDRLSKRLHALRKKQGAAAEASTSSPTADSDELSSKLKRLKVKSEQKAKKEPAKTGESLPKNEEGDSVPSQPATSESSAHVTVTKAKNADLDFKDTIQEVLGRLRSPDGGPSRRPKNVEVLKAIDITLAQRLNEHSTALSLNGRRKRKSAITQAVFRELNQSRQNSSTSPDAGKPAKATAQRRGALSGLKAEWPPSSWQTGWEPDSELVDRLARSATDWRGSELVPRPIGVGEASQRRAFPARTASTRFSKDKPPHSRLGGTGAMPESAIGSRVEGDLNPKDITIEAVEPPYAVEVPRLAHGLDRALFNPAVYWLQDPHSRVYNFEPYLQRLVPPSDFAYDRLPPFIPAARDEELWDLAQKHDRTYIGSSSGLTPILSHIYWLISGWREVDTSTLSQQFAREPKSYTFGARVPVSIFLRYKDGRYAIEQDKTWDGSEGKAANILMYLGTLMEKLMTMDPETFALLLKENPGVPGKFDKREAYHYSKSGKLLMRSQLDCYDPRLPGSGIFDLKTRGVITIRRDRLNYVENSGYLINQTHGLFNSFEREYYDMIRSAFLKYNLQVRIGNMDGIFVAYHNTARIFGFQYISKDEMDERLFGSTDMGDGAFKLSITMLQKVLDEAVAAFPAQTLRMTFETKENEPYMEVWVEPDDWNVEEQGPRPIVQLEVRSESTLNDRKVLREVDFDSVRRNDEPVDWELKYTVSQSLREPAVMDECRRGLDQARERQELIVTMFLPNGVGMEEMLAKFDTMDIADIVASRQTPSDVESERSHYQEASADEDKNVETEPEEQERKKLMFKTPHALILYLRELSRAGAAESQRLEELHSGKGKVIWRPGESASDATNEKDGRPSESTLDETESEGESGRGEPRPWWKVWD